jgi:hypothetical protein
MNASGSDVVAAVAAVAAAVSAVVAIRSARSARRSADAAERSAAAAESTLEIERERQLRASRPEFSAVLKLLSGGRRELLITLVSDQALTGMDIWISADQGVHFHGQPGVHPPEQGERLSYRAFAYDASGQPAGLRPRQSLTWPVLTARGRAPAILKVEADCRADAGRRWNPLLIQARLVQTDPTQTIW